MSTGLRKIYRDLKSHFGAKDWWPADTAFEVMVGAILAQNTAWTNVEQAITNLKMAHALDAPVIDTMSHEELASLIRPSGYYNIKSKRLKAYCSWYLQQGGYDRLNSLSTEQLRSRILRVYGVGSETADDIVLYAFNRPVFVIDTYTRRIFSRLGLIQGDEDYDDLRLIFETELGSDVPLFNEYHALIVNHAKSYCRKKPHCGSCPLAPNCTYFNGS